MELSPRLYHYKFVINGKHWINDPSADSSLSEPDNFGGINSGVRVGEYGKESAKPPPAQAFQLPEWSKHVVWYQIMLDRFRNGDPSNDPAGVLPWGWDWAAPFTKEEKKSSYGKYWSREFGGDLKGMMEKLDYLQQLGVTAIYFNPIFEAPGYSKYNTADYRHIDDNFGTKHDVEKARETEGFDPGTWTWTPTDQLFLEFLKEAHARGFKVILDGVFNHSGDNFWAFLDVIKREKDSPYANWFVITNWDAPEKWPGGPAFDWQGWAGFAGLPVYAENDSGLVPGIRKHIFDITRRWMDPNGDGDPSDGVDGWRLDAAEQVSPRFWADWRKFVKQINPDAYLCGEIWRPAPDVMQGEQFDALMNYQFAIRAVNFFVNSRPDFSQSAAGFRKSIEELLALYPMQADFSMMNLFASHDVDRIASMIKNPNRPYDGHNRPQDNPAYDISRPAYADYEIEKLMVVFQMTFPGAPMIWYGDEAGMFGADDPADRMPMWWFDLMPYDNLEYRIQRDLVDHYKKLIAIRNTYPALQTGAFSVLAADDRLKIFAYERRDDRNRLIVVLNNDQTPHTFELQMPSGKNYVNLLDPKSVRLISGKIAGADSVRSQVKITPAARKLRPEKGKLQIDLLPKASAVLIELPE